jgi:phosphatidylglycerol lysyltransferase
VQRARALVLAPGWNATAYQIVNPGIAHWFARAGDAVVGYVRHARTRVVAGAPVCAPDRLTAVVDEFESDARRAGDAVCYFGAEARLEAALHGSERHSTLLLGAQPSWRPDVWRETMETRASLRAQVSRSRNKGVHVAEWSAERSRGSGALRIVLAQWLATRGLPPLHFLVEPETLDRLDDRRVFVAERMGEPVGFVVASPVPARHGWLIEQFVRGTGAPNGTTEAMLRAAADAMAADGSQYVTLGLAPLSRNAPALPSHAPEPYWTRALLAWTKAHGRRFYNFDGLDAFKSKFAPERWEGVYAISTARRFPPRALYAIAGAFGGRPPALLIASAVSRAFAQEWRWLRHGPRSR